MNLHYLSGATWGFPDSPVEHIETHAAHVFLVADRAFKIKKDVKLPYLDFSTVGKRRAVLHREFAINRRHAPQIYIGVIEMEGEPVLVMHRFDGSQLLSQLIGHTQIDDALAVTLADAIVRSHVIAERAETPGAEIMAGLGAQLSQAFRSSADIFNPAEMLEFHALFSDALKRLTPLLNLRSTRGLVRLCHGDMHCGNIVNIDGKPTLFDAVEFNDKIATIDVLYDLAFLIMDLLLHNQQRGANIVLNRYLHGRRDQEDLSGLAALPLFLATRAGVRALVTGDLVHELPRNKSQRERGTALDYFRASIAFFKSAKPELICIGGLSGAGKSTLAASFAPDMEPAPGAIHIRSDIERKVLAGVAETERLPATSYSGAASRDVYKAMFERAEAVLAAGHSAILDAVFADASERSAAEAIAHRRGVNFRGLWLEAPTTTLKSRVTARIGDASDATAEVIDTQLGYEVGSINWSRVNASGTVAETLGIVRRMPRLPLAVPA